MIGISAIGVLFADYSKCLDSIFIYLPNLIYRGRCVPDCKTFDSA